MNRLVLLCFLALFGFGCSTTVLRQDIPVSTNPMGAKIYADGTLVGETPKTVSLERTRNHILTLVKDNYRQQDVVISKQYQSDRVLRNAVLSGINTGMFFKDKRMGITSGLGSFSRQEETGEAYILVPAAVSVSLVPLDGSSPAPPATGGYATGSAAAGSPSPSGKQGVSATDMLKAGIAVGAAVGASEANPVGKKWETSSSTKTYVTPDGTQVTKKSSTSVGVSVNPLGVLNTLDKLFN